MNYIKLLAGFFEKASDDDKLNSTHISMYMALFQFWNINHFQNPISISRNQVMKVSKICSFATYHKCIRELNEYGYLRYLPSYNPYKGSLITLFDLAPDMEDLAFENVKELSGEATLRVDYFNHTNNQTGNPQNEEEDTKNQSGETPENEVIHTEIQTGYDDFNPTEIQPSPVQALVPSINVLNVINVKDKHISENELFQKKNQKKIIENVDNQKEKSCAQKEKIFTPEITPSKIPPFGDGGAMKIPTIEEVSAHYILKNYDSLEADKFFSYFQSIGWLVGGKAKMKDWKAASRNWILNSQTFNSSKPTPPIPITSKLKVIKNKNYNEPL